MIEVRIARADDAPGILEIYRPNILQTAFSFETVVPETDEVARRIENCLLRYPWIVCTANNMIIAYVYASKYRERAAYQWTCECTVYVHDLFKGNGIGQDLYSLLFPILKMMGIKNLYAVITLPNQSSIRLHERCGFELFATYDNVGYKLGKWHKVGWWKLQLNEYDAEPAPPLLFSQMDQTVLEPLLEQAAQRIRVKLTG